MVRITNGVDVFEVTHGAYENNFKKLGYSIMKEGKKKEVVEEEVDARTDDEKFVDGIVEKPISQWTSKEIKKFAEIKGIDISETKNADEAREVISEFLK